MDRVFVTVEEMASSGVFGTLSPQTINNRFADGVFYVYKRGGKTNRANVTCKKSAEVRFCVAEYLRTKNLTWRQCGNLLNKIAGDDDSIIDAMVADGDSIDKMIESMMEYAKMELSKGDV